MITEADVLKLIREPESFWLEKTRSTADTDKFCQAICAFSNDMPDSRKCGYLLIGVNDDGSLSGLRVTDSILKEITGLRTDGNILPQPTMSVQTFSFDKGDVIVVEVTPSYEPPVRYRGRTYIRVGPRKDIATLAEENILTEKRQYYVRSYDVSPCRDASMNDIDQDAFLKNYLPLAVSQDILELDRYLGDWYEIARFDHVFERGLSHSKASYTLREDGKVQVLNSGIKAGAPKEARGKAKLTPDPRVLRVSFFGPFYGDYRIMLLDEDYQWVLVGGSSDKFLWILARTSQISDEVRETILAEATRRGYDVGKLIWVEQE